MGHLDESKGASAQTIKYSKGSVLNAIFTTALTDGVVTIHPSHGVKTPPTPASRGASSHPPSSTGSTRRCPTTDARLLVETAIESGMRWGELTEIRVPATWTSRPAS